MKTLRLPLKKEWFEMTKAGIKTEEYRIITTYWIKRFCKQCFNTFIFCDLCDEKCDKNGFKHFDTTTLTLGYPSNSYKDRIIEFEQLSISIGYGKEEWGAEPNKLYFVIKHGKRIR